MATDGPKIIDGDLARDTYWGIMDLYDSGSDIESIKKEFSFDADNWDGFDYEVYVTVIAQAFWEIGIIDQVIIDEVKKVVEMGEGVKIWRKEGGEEDARIRQATLNRLLKKISNPKSKPRKRKKYSKIRNLYFAENDILGFKLQDGSYRAVICAKITQHRGQCSYDLVATTYQSNLKPTYYDILNSYLMCRWIPSGSTIEELLTEQSGIELLWEEYPKYRYKSIGMCYDLVTHKDLKLFKDKLEKIGNIPLKEGLKQDASYGYRTSFEQLQSQFLNVDKRKEALKMNNLENNKVKVSLLKKI